MWDVRRKPPFLGACTRPQKKYTEVNVEAAQPENGLIARLAHVLVEFGKRHGWPRRMAKDRFRPVADILSAHSRGPVVDPAVASCFVEVKRQDVVGAGSSGAN